MRRWFALTAVVDDDVARTRTSCKVNCDDRGARVFDVDAAWGSTNAAAARLTDSLASAIPSTSLYHPKNIK